MNIQSYLKPAHNRSLAKWRVMHFYESLVLNQSVVLRLNFCAKMPPLRQAANRYVQAPKKPLTDNESPNRPI